MISNINMQDKHSNSGEASSSPRVDNVRSASGTRNPTLNESDLMSELKLTNSVLAYSEVISPGVSSRMSAIDFNAVLQGTVRSISHLMIDGRRLISGAVFPELKVGPNPNVLNQAFQVVSNCAPLMELIKVRDSQVTQKTTAKNAKRAAKVKKEGKTSKKPGASPNKKVLSEKPDNASAETKRSLEDKMRSNLRQKCHRSFKSEKMRSICDALEVTKDSIFEKIRNLSSTELATVEAARKISGTLPLVALGLVNDEKISAAKAAGKIPSDWSFKTDLKLAQEDAVNRQEKGSKTSKIETMDLFDVFTRQGNCLTNDININGTRAAFTVALNHFVQDILDLPNSGPDNRTLLTFGGQEPDGSYAMIFDIKSNDSKSDLPKHFKCSARLTMNKSSRASIDCPNVVEVRISSKGKDYLTNPLSFEQLLDAKALSVFKLKTKKTTAAGTSAVRSEEVKTSHNPVTSNEERKDKKGGKPSSLTPRRTSDPRTSAQKILQQRNRETAKGLGVPKTPAKK